MDKSHFPVVLISLFGLDLGAYAVGAYMQSKGYKTYNIGFDHLKIPVEFIVNDYFTMSEMEHDLFPANDLKRLLKVLDDIDPGLIGISVSSVCFRTAAWMTHAIKQHCKAPVVWGGIHAIIAPEECIEHADIVCKGEGEYVFYEIAERLRSGGTLSNISGTMMRHAKGIEDNPLGLLINDLNSLPYPDRFSLGDRIFIDNGQLVLNPRVNAGYVVGAYPIMSARGCLYNCSFCCNSIISKQYKGLGPYLRRRSVANVISELKYAVQNGALSSIRFWDDVFTYDEQWIDQFCADYPKEIGKPFVCYGHPKHTTTRVLEKLASVGLKMIFVGIQSGSKQTTKHLFKRDQSYREIVEFLTVTQKLKVDTTFDLIMDNLFETEEDEFHTSELLIQLPKPYKVLMFSLCFFPKTPLTQLAIGSGIISEKQTEQWASKALNNFFLRIPKSSNAQHKFWNCIKAMAVNLHFSSWFIRFCRQNKFFRRYPQTLFYLCRAWLLLFKRLGKQKDTNGLLPALSKGFFLDDYIIWKGNKRLYSCGEPQVVLFRKDNDKLCLRFRGERAYLMEGLEIEMYGLRQQDLTIKNIWQWSQPIVINGGYDLVLQFKGMDMVCVFMQKEFKLTLVQQKIDRLVPGTPYLIRINSIIKGKYIRQRRNKLFIAATLFNI